MAWEEWEQAKASAESTQMQLNKVAPVGGGGGNGDLVVHDDELGALGNMAHDLHGRLSGAGDHARQNSSDASTQLTTDGLDTGAALGELNNAWKSKVNTLLEACAHISNHLDYTRGAHAKDEAKIATNMQNAGGRAMTVSRIHDYIK